MPAGVELLLNGVLHKHGMFGYGEFVWGNEANSFRISLPKIQKFAGLGTFIDAIQQLAKEVPVFCRNGRL
jgi:hypothetical protein